ncbi:hypothetical protein HZS_3368 [Henneguya salminicola]|nr:hypothetical protein HZS_3368 [Henneguya salminicola]
MLTPYIPPALSRRGKGLQGNFQTLQPTYKKESQYKDNSSTEEYTLKRDIMMNILGDIKIN